VLCDSGIGIKESGLNSTGIGIDDFGIQFDSSNWNRNRIRFQNVESHTSPHGSAVQFRNRNRGIEESRTNSSGIGIDDFGIEFNSKMWNRNRIQFQQLESESESMIWESKFNSKPQFHRFNLLPSKTLIIDSFFQNSCSNMPE
jgi:hypothetical protein